MYAYHSRYWLGSDEHMLSAPLQKNINDYKPTIVGSMSSRTLKALGGALLVSLFIAGWFWLVLGIDPSDVSPLIMIAAAPFCMFGFYKPCGMPFEVYLPRYIQHRFKSGHLLYISNANKKKIIPEIKEDIDDIEFKAKKLGGYEAFNIERYLNV